MIDTHQGLTQSFIIGQPKEGLTPKRPDKDTKEAEKENPRKKAKTSKALSHKEPISEGEQEKRSKTQTEQLRRAALNLEGSLNRQSFGKSTGLQRKNLFGFAKTPLKHR